MVQGNLKLSKKKPARVTKLQKNPKAAAPKIRKPKKVNPNEKNLFKLSQKHTANLVSSTEKLIASKVGHLELLKGTRRETEKKSK
ncbi:hypothetical protein WICMUC_005850 [Wickerhamomyces mucosus]|uniref:Uncharacterized protein n=1 Tax=Wickerhamomyces mucosus TaxID=1378264 RepID=A0A9P8P342_9ASCO|nr:hypothetical protein WICMUC_005850 [Wickerhamomyces mucosus]